MSQLQAKTKQELLKMNFKQLRDHCKSLNIKLKLGETKAAMIKLILSADPPPIGSAAEPLRKEEALKQKLIDSDIYNKSSTKNANTDTKSMKNNDDHKNNSISLSAARKIVKRYCPRRGPMGMTIYPAFSSSFRPQEFKQLTVEQFTTALVEGNERLLGMENISRIASLLETWDNNGWNSAKQHLNGFVALPKCDANEKLMFSVFNIRNIIPKLRVVVKIYSLRAEVLQLLCFMETFHEAMRDICSNDVYSKIFLASILISKFRNEDIALHGNEQYKNVVDFLQRISLQPTAKEEFQSKRWDTLKKQGKLIEEIDKKVHFVMSDMDFNTIRKKAIQFGSAIEPPMARMVHKQKDKEERMKAIKQDIGSIDTKALQNKLQNALKHKLVAKKVEHEDIENEEEEEKKDNDDDRDLSEYLKMLQIGVKIDAVVHEMEVNGVKQEIIDQFADDYSEPAKIPKKAPNALMASIVQHRAQVAAIPNVAPASIPANIPPPIPAAVPFAPGPPLPVYATRVITGASARSRIPEQHDNKGLNWQKATNRFKLALNNVQRLKLLLHALDLQFHRETLNEDERKQRDDDDDDDDEKEHKVDFYDGCFNFYMAQVKRIENGLKDWIAASDKNQFILNELEVSYHTKFRPQIFSQLTTSRYIALSEAANDICEVPQDVIGVIWMFVKPFDELIELKFAVDCIHEFFAKDKKEISLKKLPIQSHRGYEPDIIL